MRVLLLAAGFSSIASAAPRDPDAVDAYLGAQMQLNHIPSIAVAIVRGGKVEKLQAYGVANLEWEIAATTDTAYQLASTTKPLTGTALMLLVQDGKLSLDDRVARFVPNAPEAWSGLTLHHLATHSSGLSDDLGPNPPANTEEAVARLAEKPLVFPPGSHSSYGIGGYVVLQHVLERVSGLPFPRFLRQRLLDPLGMTSTRFDNASDAGPIRSADTVPRRAGIYAWEDGAQRITWFHFGSDAYTAGGLLASAADLARWSAALEPGGLLSEDSLTSMWTAPSAADGSSLGFGVGWAVGRYRGRRTVGHSGGPALADVLRFPDEALTIVVLANQQKMYPYLAPGVADILLPARTEPEPAAAPDRDPALTARVRALLTAMARGEVPEEDFAPPARREFVPNARAFLVPYARSLGAPTSLMPVEEPAPGTKRRSWRVLYGTKPVRWSFELAADGKIEAFGPSAE